MRRVALLVCLLPLAACVRPPALLQGTFPPVTVADAQRQGTTGERVRWGGEIVNTSPEKDGTCFEVVSKPLDRRARPRSTDDTFGRFVACSSGFYDPAIYAPKRDVTVVGTLEPAAPGKVGESDYSFAKVRAETVFLWPEPDPRDVAYYPYWGYPGWGWGWGVGWGGYWGRGPFFVGRRVRSGRH